MPRSIFSRIFREVTERGEEMLWTWLFEKHPILYEVLWAASLFLSGAAFGIVIILIMQR